LDTILASSEILAPYVAYRLQQQRTDLTTLLSAASRDPLQDPDQRPNPKQDKIFAARDVSEEVR
jgi:hypothetical protein